MPGGPPSLWADTDTRSAPSSSRSIGEVAGGGHRVDVDQGAGARHRSTTSATGCTVPTSWLAHWQCTSAGARP